jgi:hypothetical protein
MGTLFIRREFLRLRRTPGDLGHIAVFMDGMPMIVRLAGLERDQFAADPANPLVTHDYCTVIPV